MFEQRIIGRLTVDNEIIMGVWLVDNQMVVLLQAPDGNLSTATAHKLQLKVN